MIYQDYLDQQELQRFATAMNARSKRLKRSGILSADVIRDRIFESGGCCEWCGADLVNKAFELDHVQSLSQHGQNTPDNLVVACPPCNRRKSGKHPARFAAEIYYETGKKTQLLDKIRQQYEITLSTQISLFDTNSTSHETKIEQDDDTSSTPPYQW